MMSILINTELCLILTLQLVKLNSILYYPIHFLKFQTISEYLRQEVVSYRESFC